MNNEPLHLGPGPEPDVELDWGTSKLSIDGLGGMIIDSSFGPQTVFDTSFESGPVSGLQTTIEQRKYPDNSTFLKWTTELDLSQQSEHAFVVIGRSMFPGQVKDVKSANVQGHEFEIIKAGPLNGLVIVDTAVSHLLINPDNKSITVTNYYDYDEDSDEGNAKQNTVETANHKLDGLGHLRTLMFVLDYTNSLRIRHIGNWTPATEYDPPSLVRYPSGVTLNCDHQPVFVLKDGPNDIDTASNEPTIDEILPYKDYFTEDQVSATPDKPINETQTKLDPEENKPENWPYGTTNSVEKIVPRYSLDDIGGHEKIKETIREIASAYVHPEIVARWGAKRPQGVIFHGLPGTGKTMLAHALATETNSEFWSVDSSSLYDMWMGLSAKNMQKIFTDIKNHKGNLVVFFDEMDSIVGIIEGGDTGGAVSERNQVAGVFKQALNTLSQDNPNVLLVGATNNLDRIDPSLVRSGRFDYKIYVPVPDEAGRGQIISSLIAKGMLQSAESSKLYSPDLSVSTIVKATEGMSGADIPEIFSRLARKKALIEIRTGSLEPITTLDIIEMVNEFNQSG